MLQYMFKDIYIIEIIMVFYDIVGSVICIENEVLNLIMKYIKYINHTYVYVKIKIYDIYGNSLTSNKSSSPSSEPLLHVFCADVVNGITIN
jgi:hypothetical protein